MVSDKKTIRCCFTGHRPEKLYMSEYEIKQRLKAATEQAVRDGFTTFISGMARGVDIWAAETVLNLREKDSRIKLICASPYKGFEKSWSIEERKQYAQIMEKSDFCKFVCEKYMPGCFQKRNCYMVDNSSRVIAAYNGGSGGTRNTVRYAEAKHVEVVNIFDINKCEAD